MPSSISAILKSSVPIAAISAIASVPSITAVPSVSPIPSLTTVATVATIPERSRRRLLSAAAAGISAGGITAVHPVVSTALRAVRVSSAAAVALIDCRRSVDRRGGVVLRDALGTRRRLGSSLAGWLLNRGVRARTAGGVLEIRVVSALCASRIRWTFPASATWGASTFCHAVVW